MLVILIRSAAVKAIHDQIAASQHFRCAAGRGRVTVLLGEQAAALGKYCSTS
jgi:hypothetical protein